MVNLITIVFGLLPIYSAGLNDLLTPLRHWLPSSKDIKEISKCSWNSSTATVLLVGVNSHKGERQENPTKGAGIWHPDPQSLWQCQHFLCHTCTRPHRPAGTKIVHKSGINCICIGCKHHHVAGRILSCNVSKLDSVWLAAFRHLHVTLPPTNTRGNAV